MNLRALLEELTGAGGPMPSVMRGKASAPKQKMQRVEKQPKRRDVRYEDGSGVQNGVAYGAGDSPGDVPRPLQVQPRRSQGFNTLQPQGGGEMNFNPQGFGYVNGAGAFRPQGINSNRLQPTRPLYEDEEGPQGGVYGGMPAMNGQFLQGSESDNLLRRYLNF